jgi:hypothetical protein
VIDKILVSANPFPPPKTKFSISFYKKRSLSEAPLTRQTHSLSSNPQQWHKTFLEPLPQEV